MSNGGGLSGQAQGGAASPVAKKSRNARQVSSGFSSGMKWPLSTAWPRTSLGVLAPYRKHVVAAALAAAPAPQDQQRHLDLLSAVGAVVLEVDRRAGAIFVAGRADRLGVAEAAQILGDRPRVRARPPCRTDPASCAGTIRTRRRSGARETGAAGSGRTSESCRSPPSGRSSRNGRGSARCRAAPPARSVRDGRATADA